MQAGLGHQQSVRIGIVVAAAILLLCFVERSLQRAGAQYTGLCTPEESISCDFGIGPPPRMDTYRRARGPATEAVTTAE